MDAPTVDQLSAFGTAMRSLYGRIAAGGPAGGPLRPGDHATRVDRDLENALADLATRSFRGAGVVAEEAVSDGLGAANPGAPLRVLIDPIDGTHLFNRSAPGFASTVGFELHGRLCGGVVYLPTAGRLLIAHRFRGVTTHETVETAAASDVVAVKSGLRAAVPALEHALAAQGFVVQNLGSVAGRLAALSTGHIRGVVKDVGHTNGEPRLWGIAAGLLLCEAAGVPMFWDADARVLVVGDRRVASVLRDRRIVRAVEYDLDTLWEAMKTAR